MGFQGGAGGKESTHNAGDVRDTGSIPASEDPLEEGMATDSNILARRIPWTEEPGRLQSMGLQSVLTQLMRLSTHTQKPFGISQVSEALLHLSGH